MIEVRKAAERGHFNFGWLNTYHTFSFGDYHDARFMSFRALRVINEDQVQPGKGFETHSHRDMEILSYVISGELAHKDSMGNSAMIPAGDLQYMSAGSGVTHSEFNPSKKDVSHFLQIWILPSQKGLPPRYGQMNLSKEKVTEKLRLIVTGEDGPGPIRIRQDVKVYYSVCKTADNISYDLADDRHAWLQVVRGSLKSNSMILNAGDGAAISGERRLRLSCGHDDAEFLLFDLA